MTLRPGPAVRDALTYRPARGDELEACAEVWRVATNDYLRRLNVPELQTENPPVVRLYSHLQSTDPERFIVATRADPDVEARGDIVAFAVAVVRERLWFLSMCFVLPHIQGGGVARRMIDRAGYLRFRRWRVVPLERGGSAVGSLLDLAHQSIVK